MPKSLITGQYITLHNRNLRGTTGCQGQQLDHGTQGAVKRHGKAQTRCAPTTMGSVLDTAKCNMTVRD
eukprot:6340766-Amphidinium_carterae.1